MKKNLTKSWLKNNIISINIITILLYTTSLLLSQKLNFPWPINTMGVFYLLFLTPVNIFLLLKISFSNYIEWIIASLTIFFAIFVPTYFILNYFFQIPISFIHTLLFNLSISFFVFIAFRKQFHKPSQTINFSSLPTNVILFVKQNWPLITTFLLFISLHFINYHFYTFLPEWDGYTKLIEIQNTLNNNIISINYRGFFTAAIVILTKFTQLSPYTLFTTLLILLQTTLILVIYLFLKSHKITNKIHQFIILLSTLSVPVLNLEIDATRPQNIFIILTPIYFYFLFKAITTNKYTYWILATVIALAGLNYHEFFLFIFLSYIATITVILYKKYYSSLKNKENRLVFILIIIIISLSSIILLEHIPFLHYFSLILIKILKQVSQTDKWHWWFLNNYAGDSSGQQLGWPGITGAIKYYAYYASPLIIFSITSLIYLVIKKHLKIKLLFYLIIPLVFFLLIYNELLPRLNYIYLPERIWLVIDILIILLIPTIFTNIKKSKIKINFFIFILLCLSLVGIAGTIYIAKNKKSLTSKHEFQAAQWVKQNTPKNSLFITQGGNNPMIKYFAQRQTIPTPNNFFDGSAPKEIHFTTLTEQTNNHLQQIQQTLTHTPINSTTDLDEIIKKIQNTQKTINNLERDTRLIKINNVNENIPIYALYSKDKFKGMYAEREWWLKANYYKADIDKLTEKYPLVYNKDGIYIWKIK